MAFRSYKPFTCKFYGDHFHVFDRFQCHVRRHKIKYVQCSVNCINQQYNEPKPDQYLTPNIDSEVLSKVHLELFQCKYCQKYFATKSNLKCHKRTYHNSTDISEVSLKEKPLINQCYYCQKHLSHPGNLTHHIRTHTKEKPYQCEYYRKCFAQRSDLCSHIRTHIKEKPYQ